ncbi:LacI family transcriptional regulator [Opitutaceae bacterium TAV4]|nr:LacI family transcriptional regulator [Opitutaceae bacterium TAV4]RRK02196.1 LacI family transcriptional regulator [Opitutaceae bacterium TAV3]
MVMETESVGTGTALSAIDNRGVIIHVERPMAQLVTIREVAAAAGVHFTTASLALRNSPTLRAATRERVQEAARRLGYQTNPMVAALMATVRAGRHPRNHPTLGYLTNWETPEGWREVLAHREFFAGAKQRAESMGYRLAHFYMGRTGMSPERWNTVLQTRAITGLVLASFDKVRPLPLDWSRYCAVRIDPNPPEPRLDVVTNNQAQVAQLGFQRLHERGYKRIGLAVRRLWDERLDHRFRSGYLTAQSVLGIGIRSRVPLFLSDEWTQEGFARWLRETRPDAVMTVDPLYVRPWLRALGLRVPEDIGYLNLDVSEDDPMGEVAGVRQNHTLVSARAVELLIGKLQRNERGVPVVPSVTLVEGTWVEGRSIR